MTQKQYRVKKWSSAQCAHTQPNQHTQVRAGTPRRTQSAESQRPAPPVLRTRASLAQCMSAQRLSALLTRLVPALPRLMLKWAVAHFNVCTIFFISFQLLENTQKHIYIYIFFHYPITQIILLKFIFFNFPFKFHTQ